MSDVSYSTMLPRAVTVIVEDPRGRVLLLLRGPTDPWMPGRWNLPGGKIDAGESAVEAARRETREESGLDVYTFAPLGQFTSPSGGVLDVFYADHWTGRVRMLDGEHSRSAWVPKEIAWTWDLIPSHREVLRRFAGVQNR